MVDWVLGWYCYHVPSTDPRESQHLVLEEFVKWAMVFDDAFLETAPRTFNVIDTSCLIDHVGAVNVLVATVPLLHPSPASSIQTDSASRTMSPRRQLS